MSLLQIEGVTSGYGNLPVLHDVSLRVDEGEIVAVVGPNGAGKSTLLRTVFRLLPVKQGRLLFSAQDLTALSTMELSRLGMGLVPQGANTFPDLSVEENLRVALSAHASRGQRRSLDEAYAAFPRLKDRRRQRAKTLSGGERQMLALAGAMATRPRFLALDEPTTGLAPTIVHSLVRQITAFREEGTTILWVVEENPLEILRFVDRVYLMQSGVIARELTSSALLADESLQGLFFGAAVEPDVRPRGGLIRP